MKHLFTIGLLGFLLLLSPGIAAAPNGKEYAGYVLPFPVGRSAFLLQGNNGPYGHQKALAYAYDFKMDIGSPVSAARDGTVLQTEDRFEDGNRKAGWENFIFIAHSDSTFARYTI